MSAIEIQVPESANYTWHANASYSVTAETPIRISNPTDDVIYWTTSKTGLPTVAPNIAQRMKPWSDGEGIVLESDETIYFATVAGAQFSLEV